MDTGLFPARQAQHIAYREGYYKQGTGQEISTEAKLPHALQPASVPSHKAIRGFLVPVYQCTT